MNAPLIFYTHPISWLMLFIVVASGILLFVRGRRGVRLDEHPLCRRCGFDLFGKPPGSTVCSECGADLRDAHRAIVIGHRRRNRFLMTLGIATVLLGLGLPAKALVDRVREKGLIAYEPTWLLIWTAERPGTSPATRGEIAGELMSRLSARSLSAAQISRITALALRLQQNSTLPWQSEWGDFIETARLSGEVEDESWRQYARNVYEFEMNVRPRIRRGDPLPYSIVGASTRGGWNLVRFSVEMTTRVEPDTWLPQAPAEKKSGPDAGLVGPTAVLSLDRASLDRTADGEHRLRTRSHVKIFEGQQAPSPLVEYDLDLDGTWVLVPESESTVELINDDSLTDAMTAALGNVELEIGSNQVDLQFRTSPLSQALAHDVFVREDGREWWVGSITLKSGSLSILTSSERAPAPAGDEVDLIFRPNPALAAETIEMTRIWNGQIVLHHVKVNRR